MHMHERYDEERASDILNTVRSFMRHLATRLSEPEVFPLIFLKAQSAPSGVIPRLCLTRSINEAFRLFGVVTFCFSFFCHADYPDLSCRKPLSSDAAKALIGDNRRTGKWASALQKRFLTVVEACCPEPMRWFGRLSIWLGNIGKRTRINNALSSYFFFSAFYHIFRERVISFSSALMRSSNAVCASRAARDFFLQFYDRRVAGHSIVNILQSLSRRSNAVLSAPNPARVSPIMTHPSKAVGTLRVKSAQRHLRRYSDLFEPPFYEYGPSLTLGVRAAGDSCLIGEPLVPCHLAPQRLRAARHSRRAERGCCSESRTPTDTVQVLFLTVLINAAHTALKHAEIVLDRIGVHVAAHIFASGVLHPLMPVRVANRVIKRAFIGVQHGAGSKVLRQKCAARCLGSPRSVERAHGPAALAQGQ